MKTMIKNGYVNFTHFAVAYPTITTSMIVTGWDRCVAYQTKANNPGIDFIIPVMVVRSDDPKDPANSDPSGLSNPASTKYPNDMASGGSPGYSPLFGRLRTGSNLSRSCSM